MSFDADRLLALLPAIYRIRDEELARANPQLLTPAEKSELAALESTSGPSVAQQERRDELVSRRDQGPLKALLKVIAEELAGMEENLDQLYDDQFIETCAEWVVPYIGDLIGYRPLHGVAPGVVSARAEVAHTIAFRRRKGTAAMLEQLARDVTGWPARAVEYFQRLGVSQYMNHYRPDRQYGPDLRHPLTLAAPGSAFDTTGHTVDVRRIGSGRGRYNIPNIGLFLWRISARPVTRSPAVAVGDRRYRIHPLNMDTPLYNHPVAENGLDHLAERVHVPAPLSRRLLHDQLGSFYGSGKSLALFINGEEVPQTSIRICHLGDHEGSWGNLPGNGFYAIDPELGRLGLPADLDLPAQVEMTWHEGCLADIGGGEYERGEGSLIAGERTEARVPDDFPTVQAALNSLDGDGLVEITDNGRYQEAIAISAGAGSQITLRAANGRRPLLELPSPMLVRGGADSEVTLDGLLITGKEVRLPGAASNRLARLTLTDTTLVPGHGLDSDGAPVAVNGVSLKVLIPSLKVAVSRSILGALRLHGRSEVQLTDSIIDATHRTRVAFSAPNGKSAGGTLTLNSCTMIGKIHAAEMALVSNSLLLAGLKSGDSWPVAVHCQRKQTGCVRFSYLPVDARVPARYQCHPSAEEESEQIFPRFSSLRYGAASYCQLAQGTVDEIRRGAEDEGEIGVYHHLYQPQREINLRVRLEEYLRVGLEAGVFYET